MSNGLQRNLSQRKAVKSALERIDSLEQDMMNLAGGINEAMIQANNRMTGLAKIIEAVVELFGAETVDAKIKEVEKRNQDAALDAAKKALEDGVSKGDLQKTDVVGDRTLIVGREFDKEGNLIPPGRVQLMFAGVRPEFQEKIKGQSAGFSVETPSGGKFEIMDLYTVIERAPEPVATDAVEAVAAAVEAAPVATPVEA
jgi:hypothetical protein